MALASPRRNMRRTGDSARASVSPVHRPAHGLAVLLVDDHRGFLESLARLFEQAGWRVTTATTAASARRLALTRRFDFLVVDLRLPDQTGLALLQGLLAAGITTPAAILTGYPEYETALMASAMNVRYLAKGKGGVAELLQTASAAATRRQISSETAPTAAALRAMAATLRRSRVEAIPAISRTLAERLAGTQLSFTDFMSITEALRLTIERRSTPDHLANRIETLAERFDGRRRVAEAIGIEESFTRAVATSTPTAVDASTPAIVGWPERLTEQSAVMRRGLLDVANTSEQVAQIAYRLGYDHHTVFTKQFHSFFGCSPTVFRKLLKVND
jgi:ActR/RegA family two-component response regulator